MEPNPTADRRAFYTCPLCEATCGLDITLRGQEILHIRGDKEDVFSKGFVCPKGATLKQLHEDPDRLRQPMMRDGDTWRAVSWEEAFAEVERQLMPILEQHGRDAVALYFGNPTVHNLAGALYARPLAKALGSKNAYSASTVDQMPKHVSCGLLFGHPDLIPVPDLDRTDYLLMLGANPMHSNGSLCTAPDFPGRLKAIRRRGGKVVVVDPRRSWTAQKADEHRFIRPGTDVYLLFGIIHTLLDENLARPGRLAGHTDGFAEVEAWVRPFSSEAVATATGIEAATIRRLARELAASPTAAVYGRIGTHTVPFGTLSSWAVDVINLLTGNLDRAGGAMFPHPAHSRWPSGKPGRGFLLGRWHSRVRHLPEVRGELPVATLADEIETPGQGQVRALLTIGGNPVLSTPHSTRLDAALATLDFMVSVDPYLNETTRHAHVILPPPPPLARSHYDYAFYHLSVRNVANYSPPLLDHDGLPEYDILARLVLIVGGMGAEADPALVHAHLLAEAAQRAVSSPGSPVAGRDAATLIDQLNDRPPTDRLIDLLLRAGPHGDGFGADPDGLSLAKLEARPHGIDLGPLGPRFPEALRTASGKIELAAAPLVAEVARLKAALDDVSGHEAGSFVLVGRRHLRSNNSWMHNVEALVKGKDRCTLHLHPDDAAALGLADGDVAEVASRVGRVEAPVEVTADIMPGVVSLPHGWGHTQRGARLSVAARHPGVNANVLTDPAALDPLSGNAVLNALPVTVKAMIAQPA